MCCIYHNCPPAQSTPLSTYTHSYTMLNYFVNSPMDEPEKLYISRWRYFCPNEFKASYRLYVCVTAYIYTEYIKISHIGRLPGCRLTPLAQPPRRFLTLTVLYESCVAPAALTLDSRSPLHARCPTHLSRTVRLLSNNRSHLTQSRYFHSIMLPPCLTAQPSPLQATFQHPLLLHRCSRRILKYL